MLRLPVVVLSLLGLAQATVVFRDSTSPPTDLFSEAELKCILKGKVLHSDGQCYTLLQSGPCSPAEWLVMARNSTGSATDSVQRLACVTRPCDKALRVFWPKDRQCHKLSDKARLCPYQDNTLTSDPYGDGRCACAETHVRLRQDIEAGRNTTAEWEGNCHPLYKRGPCQAGKVLHPVYMEGHGMVGVCEPDPCRKENDRAPQGGGGYARGEHGCQRLEERGSCRGHDELFRVHPQSLRPRCFNTVNSLYGDSAMRCDGNVDITTSECKEALELNMQNNPFVTEVTRGRRVKRRG